ncbi:MAG: acyltransferase family protein [Microthrixaceae bacterium]
MTSAAAPVDRSQGGASGYRPHLDGVRAIAVYLVVAFHARVGAVSGGFIGVDVFFVLSGYLVTSLLLRDLDDRGSIDLRRFYARRVRRLLPAAAVVLVLTTLIYGLIASPVELLDARGAVRAASLYVANWFYLGQSTDYFAPDVRSSPVLHFWSLSVEEQYYLAWPLLVGGLHVVTRRSHERQRQLMVMAVAAGLVLSLAAALWVARTDLDRAYYGTDTRAYQLLAGGLLALMPSVFAKSRSGDSASARFPVVLGQVASLAVLGVAASSVLGVGAITRGVVATAATVGLLVTLGLGGGPVRRLLSLRPITYLGRISYATYLWHWIVVLVIGARLDVGPGVTLAIAAAVSTGLASLSYQILELPVRESPWLDRRRVQVIAVGLGMSILVGLVVAPQVLEARRGTQVDVRASEFTGLTAIPAGLDWRSAANDKGKFYPKCRPAKLEGCTVVDGGEPRVMLIGDSNAKMYLPTFEALARERSFTLLAALTPGCFWMRGIQRLDPAFDAPCRTRQAEWYDTIVPALAPDVVVLVNRAVDDASFPIPIKDQDRGPLEPRSRELLDTYRRRVDATVGTLRAQGARVVIIEPAPVSAFAANPLQCLSRATYLDECRFVATAGPTATERIYRDLSRSDPDIRSLDLDRLLCPFLPICDPVVNGLIVRWDPAHLTQRFAVSIAPSVGEVLESEGILPRSQS